MPKTEPEPIREPRGDHLLTPENCVVTFIDYQPEQYSTITSTSTEAINLGVVALAKLATAYDVPVVLSTVGVDLGVNTGTTEALRSALPDVEEIDRTGVNAWEDADFRDAIRATGRRKVVIAGLWTEVCLTFPTLDMLAEGYDVYPHELGAERDGGHRLCARRDHPRDRLLMRHRADSADGVDDFATGRAPTRTTSAP